MTTSTSRVRESGARVRAGPNRYMTEHDHRRKEVLIARLWFG
jgi:hypothetical protein